MTKTQNYVLIGAAVLLAIAGTAIASSYVTKTSLSPEPELKPVATVQQPVHRAAPRPQQVAATRPACDDHNIVGTVGGAVVGGLVGSQFGKGNGKGIATAGGAVAGGALGNAYVPTRGATCD